MLIRNFFKKISSITTATAIKTKKLKIVAEAVEKMQKKKKLGKSTENESLHYTFTTDSNIFAETLHPQAKKANILVDSEQSNEHFYMETTIWENFGKNRNSSHLIGKK